MNLNRGTAMAWSCLSYKEEGDHEKGISKRSLAAGADISNRINDGGGIDKRVIIAEFS